ENTSQYFGYQCPPLRKCPHSLRPHIGAYPNRHLGALPKNAWRELHLVCADDAHGAAIMLKAEEMQLSPEELIAQVKAEHEKDFAAFHIHYDNYYTTHSEENREL